MPGHRRSYGFLVRLPRLLFYLAQMARPVAFFLYRRHIDFRCFAWPSLHRNRSSTAVRCNADRFTFFVSFFVCTQRRCAVPDVRVFFAPAFVKSEQRALLVAWGWRGCCSVAGGYRATQTPFTPVHTVCTRGTSSHDVRCIRRRPRVPRSAPEKLRGGLRAHGYMACAAHSAGSSCSSDPS